MPKALPAPSPGRAGLRAAGAVALSMAGLQALPSAAHALLRYDRTAILEGELWRLFSGHFIHLGWAHWALNAAGLMLCIVLADRPIAPAWLMGRMAALGLGVSLMLLAFDPKLSRYVGLSGVLYGLFVLALWPQARRGEFIGLAALCVLLGWMAWQMVAGPMRGEEALIGGSIVTQAHLYGVASAAVAVALESLRRRRPDRPGASGGRGP